MKKINAVNKTILLIPDLHIPYEHRDFLRFIKAVAKKNKPNIVINLGDEADWANISFHPTDQELYSAGHELEITIQRMAEWYKAFPEMLLLESNHGSLLYRRFKAGGIPIHAMKPLSELYETPDWTWHEDILIKTKQGEIYGCHGKTGVYNKLAREMGCSCFQGHYHGKFEITWSRSVLFERFNMFVGCGIDRKSLAFAYGKNHLPKPILGCGVIDEIGMPHLVKMHLNKKGRWTGVV